MTNEKAQGSHNTKDQDNGIQYGHTLGLAMKYSASSSPVANRFL